MAGESRHVITCDPVDLERFRETDIVTPALRDALRYAAPLRPSKRTTGLAATVLRPVLERLHRDARVALVIPPGTTADKVARAAYDWALYRGLRVATRSDGVAVHVFVLARPGVPVAGDVP